MSELPGTEAALARGRALVAVDDEVARAVPDEHVLATLRDDSLRSVALLAEACRVYADRPCCGERARAADGTLLPQFVTTSFGALWQRVQSLAAGVQSLVAPGERVGICGFASIEFVITDLACLCAGVVSVPLATGVSATDLLHIVAETTMRCLFCSVDHLGSIAPMLDKIATLVVFDVRDERDTARARELERPGLDVRICGELRAERLAPLPDDSERLVSILYSSGTTGKPKGAMYLDRVWVRRMRYTLPEPGVPHITIGCLPLNHVIGRFSVYRTMMRGGVTYFVGASNMSTLFEDIRLVRPTLLTLVPRITAEIRQHFAAQLVERPHDADAIKTEMRESFVGGRLCLLITGSAATPPETIELMKAMFDISVLEYYAFNEVGLVSTNGRVDDGIEYQLVDVPELGYSTRDVPHPRGELLVRSRDATPGNWAEPPREDVGWLRCGDIMEEYAPRQLRWVDRRTSVIKLAQGEFVSLSRLEDTFVAESPLIAQLHLHASSQRSYLVAVIVPARDDVDASALRAELDRVARIAQLPSHEVPRDFIVERTPFSKDTGLLTEAGKQKRGPLTAHYGTRLEALYAEHEARRLAAIDPTDDDVATRVRALVSSTLGVADVDASRSFTGLGGDSLAAVKLSERFARSFGFSPPVASLLDARTSVSELVTQIERGGRSRFSELHGDAPTLQASALQLDTLLPRALLESVRPVVDAPHAILLTGAAGFLGRFLLLELLERLPADGRVVGLVRAANDDAAYARVAAGFSGDELAARFDQAARGRLEVVAGDLMRPSFGMEAARYQALAGSLDTIVHAGALVNHALTYAQLLEPNVLGTAEVARFALTGRTKRVAFTSSSGVAAGLARVVSEDESAAQLWPQRAVGGDESGRVDYAAGYATSKWVSEVLLDRLAERGVPVQLFRCSMILPHRRYLGQLNEGDQITRLLRGLIATGVAPRSFYRDVVSPHFDGIAVDVVAAAIAAIVLDGAVGRYHVSNARWDDGVSLDDFARWTHTAGVPLTTIDDYDAWFETLRARLEKLPEAERRRSPLPLITRWARPASSSTFIRLDSARFQSALERLRLPALPIVDEDYVHHVLRSLQAASSA